MNQRAKSIFWVVLVLLSGFSARMAGTLRERAEWRDFFEVLLPSAQYFEPLGPDLYLGYLQAGPERLPLGYVALGKATGHSGPLEVAVGVDMEGIVISVSLVRQTETTAFMRKVLDRGLPSGLLGRSCTETFVVGRDVDAVTGATTSAQALVEAVRDACHRIARMQGLAVAQVPEPRMRFGLPEIVLISVYVVGYLAYGKARQGRYPYLQWASLILGFILIGCWLGRPMSLVHINSLLLGYWPGLYDQLYWYLLVGGVLLPILLTGESPYCHHICPFGATQTILARVGIRKRTLPRPLDLGLRWGQRLLVWIAVLCALIFRNPAVVNYEVTGVLFGRSLVLWQFVLLAGVLLASLVITRPWCNYLCPIRVVVDFVGMVRRAVGLKHDRGQVKLETGNWKPGDE